MQVAQARFSEDEGAAEAPAGLRRQESVQSRVYARHGLRIRLHRPLLRVLVACEIPPPFGRWGLGRRPNGCNFRSCRSLRHAVVRDDEGAVWDATFNQRYFAIKPAGVNISGFSILMSAKSLSPVTSISTSFSRETSTLVSSIIRMLLYRSFAPELLHQSNDILFTISVMEA